MSSARRSASSRYCVVRMIVVPSRTRSREHVPQVVAAARVEAGGRLVEEQHLGAADEAGGEVEPAAHAAGEGLHQPVGGVGEVEPLEQLVGALARRRLRQVVQPADHHEVEPGAHQAVDGGLLGGDADAARAPRRRGRRRRSRRRWRCPRSAGDSVVRMRMAVVLPAPLWPSRPSTVPGRDVEVEVAQGPQVAEALAEAGGGDAATRVGVAGGVGDRRIRMVYCIVVHSTTNISSTLYDMASENRTKRRRHADGRRSSDAVAPAACVEQDRRADRREDQRSKRRARAGRSKVAAKAAQARRARSTGSPPHLDDARRVDPRRAAAAAGRGSPATRSPPPRSASPTPKASTRCRCGASPPSSTPAR